MKRILITGENSYIGTSFENWLANYPDTYKVDTISVRGSSWKEKDFSGYDVVFHVAGIAHVKETKRNQQLYHDVNRDLAYEAARKAKDEGVQQFIFLSSMSVYGMETGIIRANTVPNPKNHYGKSKLQAEELIRPLNDDSFRVAIIRPPMVYGKNCKGNYPRLARLAKSLPIFPNFANKRSMIFIDNLCEFIRLVVDDSKSGIFFPQNSSYISVPELVYCIGLVHGREIRLTRAFNWLIEIGLKVSSTFRKVFGTLIYDMGIVSSCDVLMFEQSIFDTESSSASSNGKGTKQ